MPIENLRVVAPKNSALGVRYCTTRARYRALSQKSRAPKTKYRALTPHITLCKP